MSKYEPLWDWIKENGTDSFKLTYDEIEKILNFKLDHSFLTYKKRVAGIWVLCYEDIYERTDCFFRES